MRPGYQCWPWLWAASACVTSRDRLAPDRVTVASAFSPPSRCRQISQSVLFHLSRVKDVCPLYEKNITYCPHFALLKVLSRPSSTRLHISRIPIATMVLSPRRILLIDSYDSFTYK